MRSILRLGLLPLCVAACSPCMAAAPNGPTVEARQAIAHSAAWLWSQQATDGGWHSEQYGVLRSGQALTPFLLHTLLSVPEDICPRPEGGVEKALAFIRRHVDDNGAIGHADPDIVEYPIYSTSYALQCLLAAQDNPDRSDAADRQTIRRMVQFLTSAQYHEANGFATTHPAYGGWGFDRAAAFGEPGHMDLAHTRRALDALRSHAVTTDQLGRPEFSRAELFLRVVQRHPGALAGPSCFADNGMESAVGPFDGGFYFSPCVEAANKGRLGDAPAPHFRSYATATCDGILALIVAGVGRDDRRIVRAAEWLHQHEDFDFPQGVSTTHPEPWGEAIRFYHYAVRAEAYAALDWPGDWRQRLPAGLLHRQRPDGSFQNTDSPLMKEDDPLLCTGLAVVALVHCGR